VSEKTVFNHFATKEDLAFAGGEARLGQLLDDLAQRPPGTSVLDVFRATTGALLDGLARAAKDDDDLLVLARIVRGSPILQERLTTGFERESAALGAAIAKSVGAAEDDVVAAVAARALAWTHRSVFGAAVAGLLAGEPPRALAKRLRAEADRAYDQLGTGLADYGRVAAVPA
jgi:AcrR family transcriptional regulator